MSNRTYPSIAAYLDATGSTQVELAERLGISQAYLSKIARGLQQPSLDEALRISRILRVPVESLVSENNKTSLTDAK